MYRGIRKMIAVKLPIIFDDRSIIAVDKPASMLSVPGREGRVTYDSPSRSDQWLQAITALVEQPQNIAHYDIIQALRGRGYDVPRSESKFTRYLQRVTKVRDETIHKAIWEQLCSIDRNINSMSVSDIPDHLISAADLVEEYVGRKVMHVHRLDQETSGLLVFAKNDVTANYLAKQFRERIARKVYVAKVHGIVEEPRGIIQAPLCADEENKPRQKVDHTIGKESITHYEVITSCSSLFSFCQELFSSASDGSGNESYTMLQLSPLTGRTHQLRVHLSHIGHSIVGDSLYSSQESSSRLCLHALQLTLLHPDNNEPITFSTLKDSC